MGEISRAVATASASGAAQRVTSRMPDIRNSDALYNNPHLVDELFVELYPNKKVPPDLARALLSVNVPTDAAFEHVLAVETRSSVLVALLENGAPAPDRLMALANSKALSRALVDKLVTEHNHCLSTQWLQIVAPKVGSKARLELWLRAPEQFSDSEISDALLHHNTWGTGVPDSTRLPKLLATRPGVVAGAARSDNLRVRTFAAGSRHLRDLDLQLASAGLDVTPVGTPVNDTWVAEHTFPLLALCNNPVVGNDVVSMCDHFLQKSSEWDKCDSARNRLKRRPEPVTASYELEDAPDKLAWLLRRCLPTDTRPEGRVDDLIVLLSNPNLGAAEARHVWSKLHEMFEAAPELVTAYDALMDRFPEENLGHMPPARQEDPVFAVRQELPQSELSSRAPQYSVIDLRRPVASAVRYLEQELGEDEAAWAVALMTAENNFRGTLSELVTVARAVVA